MRRILNKQKVRMSGSGVMVGCTPSGPQSEPVVVLRRDSHSGRIEQVEVTCSCGEVVMIDCHYGQESNA